MSEAMTTKTVLLSSVVEEDRQSHEDLRHHHHNEYAAPYESRPVCDRRLSRAARTLLSEHIRYHQEQQQREGVLGEMGTVATSRERKKKQKNGRVDEDEEDIWTLLDDWLRDARPEECPLFSSRDILRHDEEHSIPIKPSSLSKNLHYAYPTSTLKERRKNNNKSSKKNRPLRWWKCGICNKIFHTRYYLDQHLDTYHHHDHHHHRRNEKEDGGGGILGGGGDYPSRMLVCPATDWCPMLGLINCHLQALEDEPYYGAGSGSRTSSTTHGWNAHDDTGRFIQHGYRKIAESISCHPDIIQMECSKMLEQCRVKDGGSFCESITCPVLHHHTYLPSFSMLHGNWDSIWHNEMNYYQRHQSRTLIGIILCMILSFGVYYYYYHSASKDNDDDDDDDSNGKNELRKLVPKSSSRPLGGTTTTYTTTTNTRPHSQLHHRETLGRKKE